MQIGFLADGTKKDVLASLQDKADSAVAILQRDCKDMQIPVYDETGKVTGHKLAPIPETTAGDTCKAVIKHIAEQVSYCKDDDAISVVFNLTIHRPNPSL